jgi:general secretion pathway protein G
MRRFISFILYTSVSVSRIYQYLFVKRLTRMRTCPAMTLLELLIIMALVGTLAAIGIPAYNNYIDRAKNSQAIEDIRFIEAAINVYLTEHQVLPDTLNQVSAAQRLDPWNDHYQYLRIGGLEKEEVARKWRKDRFLVPLNSDFDLYSMGKDRASKPPLTSRQSRDDIVRANNGAFVGLASEY